MILNGRVCFQMTYCAAILVFVTLRRLVGLVPSCWDALDLGLSTPLLSLRNDFPCLAYLTPPSLTTFITFLLPVFPAKKYKTIVNVTPCQGECKSAKGFIAAKALARPKGAAFQFKFLSFQILTINKRKLKGHFDLKQTCHEVCVKFTPK